MSLSESDGEIELLIFEDQNNQEQHDGFNLPDISGSNMPLEDPFINTEPPPLDIDYETTVEEKPNEILPQGEFSMGIAYPTSCSFPSRKKRNYNTNNTSHPNAKRVKYNNHSTNKSKKQKTKANKDNYKQDEETTELSKKA